MTVTGLFGLSVWAQQTISLEGAWQFSCGDSTQYQDYVMLPGSMLTNGKGDTVTADTRWTGSTYDSSYYRNPYMEKYRRAGQVKYPFFLTPEKYYVGKAWYKRGVYVPQSWAHERVTLFLERPHIETTVYVNGLEVGHQSSLSTPHEYDISPYLIAGQRNTIAVCVYNGIENVGVGQDSHSVTDQTQGNWNGIVGRLELRAQPSGFHIKQVELWPLVDKGALRLRVKTGGRFNPFFPYHEMEVVMWLDGAKDGEMSYQRVGFDDDVVDVELPVGPQLKYWDEFHPHFYHLGITVEDDYYETTFGMRSIQAEGRQLYINGRPLWLRGTVENCCFPETGYPPTDETAWAEIITKCKTYGLNHMRFHSYCPPEAAFAAADKLGFYLQVEGPTWPNHGVKLGVGQVIDQYLMDESKRIIDSYGHHPSFVMMAAGNEPAGHWVDYCNRWVRTMYVYDPTKLYCGASVGGGWAWDDGSQYHVKGGGRGLDWKNHAPQSADDYYSQIEFPRNYRDSVPNQSPVIAHEQGQWCAFPDFKEIPQYTGVYQARNFEIFRDLLQEGGMGQQAEKFLVASGRLQTLCYKYEIERNLRTPDYAGFQLLALNDYSGQGTALEGVLNVHWREKSYTRAKDWVKFCAPLVALARFPKFVYSNRDTLEVPVEVYQAMYAPITNIRNTYYIADDSMKVLAGGLLSMGDLPIGKNINIGTVRFPLDKIKTPRKLTLSVAVAGKISNQWDFWVYPEDEHLKSASASVFVADSLTAEALAVLRGGGKVLLTAAGKVKLGSDVVQHYLPVFWNTSWFKMRPPLTTGAYIDSRHPLFKHDFPTDGWSNLNWWELLNKAQVMNLQDFPKDYQPPIQPIDTWHVSRKLGMLVEANVLKGKLLITTMDIDKNLDNRLVARQMRHAILDYMESDDFKPTLTLDAKIIADLFTKEAPKVDMYTKESPDELKPKLK